MRKLKYLDFMRDQHEDSLNQNKNSSPVSQQQLQSIRIRDKSGNY